MLKVALCRNDVLYQVAVLELDGRDVDARQTFCP